MDQLLGPERPARHASAPTDAYRWAEVTDKLIERGWLPNTGAAARPILEE